ncbi:MAG TPA: diphthine--ammonia ligase [Thermoplasmata archaeon]|nr:diphthine--ammonia ligase [Thermoplasmata archaeon]
MRVAALFSGGKDSTYATYVAMQRGWEVSHLVTIRPKDPESVMFHVPNLHLTPLLAEAMGIPHLTADAEPGEEGELEALKKALSPLAVDGLVTGAVASDYQHSRINRVGHELGLRVFSPLWRLDQEALLRDYLAAGMRVMIVGAFAEGLDESWLGRVLDEPTAAELLRLHRQRGVSPIGEGGEYESLVLDAPFFRERLEVTAMEKTWRGTSGHAMVQARHVPKV